MHFLFSPLRLDLIDFCLRPRNKKYFRLTKKRKRIVDVCAKREGSRRGDTETKTFFCVMLDLQSAKTPTAFDPATLVNTMLPKHRSKLRPLFD